MRNEADIGKHYETQILPFISLKCLLDESIEDFWIKFNPANVGTFDDIVLYVEYKNRQKEVFLMQLKHKNSDKTVIAKMFQTKKKDFNLDNYQKAFKKITEDSNFFVKNNISQDTKKFFVLYNNSKISVDNIQDFDEESDNGEEDIDENTMNVQKVKTILKFEHLTKTEFRAFLSRKTFSQSTGFKLKCKKQCYDQHFLDNFYFYPDQLNLEDVILEIEQLSGLKHVADNFVHYFDEYTKPTNKMEKICKENVKILVLSSIFGNFQPPIKSTNYTSILDIVRKFDVSVITDVNSENVIWTEILSKMKNHYEEDSLELSNWQKPIPENLQLKFGSQTCIKDLYFRMVATTDIPLYIKTDNLSLSVFKDSMFPKLGVHMVVFNSKNEKLQFTELKVLESMKDVDKQTYLRHMKNTYISFRGNQKVPLLPMIENDEFMRELITVDLFIKLLSNPLSIGVKDDSDTIYINRTLNISTIKEDVLSVNENACFIICDFPKGGSFKLKTLLKIGENNDRFQKYYNISNFNYFIGMTEDDFNVITTTEQYNEYLLEIILEIVDEKTFYILQYVSEDADGCRFILLKTNGKRDIFKHYLSGYMKKDTELIDFFRKTEVNFICNKGGMGKSMLLKYLLKRFPSDKWVIHVELGKYRPAVEKIGNYDDFIRFFYEYNLAGADPEFSSISQQLYQYSTQNGNLIFLLDDCDEVIDLKLLNFFKEALNSGMKLWIVARPGLREEFENFFQTFSMELNAFTVNDQARFFQKFLRKRGRNEHDIQRKLRSIEDARCLLEDSFIGNCQQTMMLAVVFDTDEEITLKRNRVDELYERFINLKINQHYQRNRSFILRTVSKLALMHFFSKAVLEKLFDWSEFQCDIEVFQNENLKTALVTYYDQNTIPEFSHKTYAEFLAGRWIAEHVRKQIEKKTPFNLTEILRLLYLQELTNVRLFFDTILTEKDLSEIDISRTDILGRNFLHLYLSYGDRYDMQPEAEVKKAVRIVEEHPQIKHCRGKILVKVPESPIVTTHNATNIKLGWSSIQLNVLASKKDTFLNLNPVECAVLTGCLRKLDDILMDDFISVNLSTMEFNKYFILVYCINNRLNHILRRLDNLKEDKELLRIRDMSTNMSLLHMAVKSMNFEGMKIFLESFPVEKWGTDNDNNTPLHIAFNREYNSALKVFEEIEITSKFFNLKDRRGYNHLHCAVLNRNLKWVEIMLKCSGVEVDAKCSYGNTPFMLSIINNNLQIAKKLKEKKANINHKNNKFWTALHFTASKGLVKCTEQLIKWRAKIDIRNSYGETPLIRATIKGNKAIVQCLLKHGADLDSCDGNEWTALHHAVKRKHISIVRLLLEKKAEVDALNKIGNTPLIIACLSDVPEAVGMLLDHHAEVNYRSDKGTALEISVRENHTKCITMIKNKVRDRHLASARLRSLPKIVTVSAGGWFVSSLSISKE